MQEQTSWWNRNWRWFLPFGCLTVVVVGVAAIAGLVALLLSALGSSDVVEMAVERARANPEVQAVLGQPIEKGWLVTGEMNATPTSGSAQFSVPLTGPNAAGTLRLVAEKGTGPWKYSVLVLEVKGSGEQIDLLVEQVDHEDKALVAWRSWRPGLALPTYGSQPEPDRG